MGAVLIKEIEKDISRYMHLKGLPALFCFRSPPSPPPHPLSYVREMSFCPIKLHLSSWWPGTNAIYDTLTPFPGRVVLRWFPGHKYPGDNKTTIRRCETSGMFPWNRIDPSQRAACTASGIWERNSTRAVNRPWQEAYSETMLDVSKHSFSGHFCLMWLRGHVTGTKVFLLKRIHGIETLGRLFLAKE